MYKEFIVISTLIIVHECGHFFCAKLLGFKTDKIYLYPLGGISKFYMPISTERKKELLVLMMGPIFQNIAYVFLILLLKEKEFITSYHLGILSFNLLPIYPLDGGKILDIITSSFIPYKKSLKITILLSYIITVFIFYTQRKISINMILIYIVLLYVIRKEDLKQNDHFQLFLLERYLHPNHFKKDKIITKESSFYRYKNNRIKRRETIQNEEEYLRKKYNYFDKKC